MRVDGRSASGVPGSAAVVGVVAVLVDEVVDDGLVEVVEVLVDVVGGSAGTVNVRVVPRAVVEVEVGGVPTVGGAIGTVVVVTTVTTGGRELVLVVVVEDDVVVSVVGVLIVVDPVLVPVVDVLVLVVLLVLVVVVGLVMLVDVSGTHESLSVLWASDTEPGAT